MKILLLALLVCYTSGRPQDPVNREFGTQPNNPNVKVFSTYPTSKPVTRQDNPNDLKKIDNEKLEKDEKENTELKGEELDKADNDEGDLKANSTTAPDNETDAETSSPTVEKTDMSEDLVEAMNETESVMNVPSSMADEQPLNENSSDIIITEVVPVLSEAAFVPENEAGDYMVTVDPNPPIIDEPIIPLAEPELLIPIGIETPINIFPLTNEELEDEYFLTIPDIEDEDPIFGLGDQTPFLNSGVLLPALIPDEESPYMNIQNEDLAVNLEATTLPPIVEEQSLDKTMIPAEQGNLIKPEIEINGELLQPMASLTDQSSVLDPFVETNEPALFEENPSITLEEETTESNIDMIPVEGDIGASLPMSYNIPPVVEIEPNVMMEPENMTDELIVTEVPDMPKEKYSLKIAKADQKEETTGEEIVTEDPTEKLIQMAGFMSEELKSSEPSMADTTIPSTTELIFVLNITDTKDDPKLEQESTAEAEQTKTEPEPMDNLDNLESFTEKTVQSTTENMPIVNPDELTNDDVNNDLTQNETI